MRYQHEDDERAEERKARRPISAPLPLCSSNRWWQFSQYLSGRGLDPDLAHDNFWYPSLCAGDDLPRIVIPATNMTGHCYWQARAMVDTEKRYQSPPVPRGDSIIIVWPKYTATKMVVCEGPLDALAAAECGCLGVSLMGNAPNRGVLNHVVSICPSLPLLVVGDTDDLAAAAGIAVPLSMRRPTKFVMLNTRDGKDLAALTFEQRKALVD